MPLCIVVVIWKPFKRGRIKFFTLMNSARICFIKFRNLGESIN